MISDVIQSTPDAVSFVAALPGVIVTYTFLHAESTSSHGCHGPGDPPLGYAPDLCFLEICFLFMRFVS